MGATPEQQPEERRYICGIQQEAIGCPGCGSPPVDQVVDAVLQLVRRRLVWRSAYYRQPPAERITVKLL